MKTKMAILSLALLAAGCTGKEGAAGLPGAPGAPATNSMVTRNGAVTSDSIAVSIPGLSLSRGDLLAVYTCIGTACVQVNIWQAGISNNVYYIAQGTTVTINGAQTGAQTLWYISALERI